MLGALTWLNPHYDISYHRLDYLSTPLDLLPDLEEDAVHPLLGLLLRRERGRECLVLVVYPEPERLSNELVFVFDKLHLISSVVGSPRGDRTPDLLRVKELRYRCAIGPSLVITAGL